MRNHLKRMSKTFKLKAFLLSLLILSFVVYPVERGDAADKLAEKYKNALNLKPIDFSAYSESQLPTYSVVLNEQRKSGAKDVQDSRVDIPAAAFIGSGSEKNVKPVVQTGIGDTLDQAVVWQDEIDWIEWSVEAPEDGFYNIELTYYPIEGKRSSIDRSLKIDNEFSFNEAQRLTFYRMWADQAEPKINSQGDDIRPKQVEVPRWETVRLTDNEGKYAEPFRFYMKQGIHTLRFDTIKEPIAISQISLVSPETVPTYSEVKQQNEHNGYKKAVDQMVKIQAEKVWYKTEPTLRRESNSDPNVEPPANGNQRLNVIGDFRWRKGGQYLTWMIDVPEDGLYKIGLKNGQWWGDGLPSYRKIELDGKVPFKELEEYAFPFSKDWRMTSLGNEDGDFLFYLPKGMHTMRITVQLGPYRDVLQSLSDTIFTISELNRKIIMVTGTKPDMNFRYELERRVPNLIEDLKSIADSISYQIDLLEQLSSSNPAVVQSLKAIREQYQKMANNPDDIPKQLDDITNTQGQLGNWLLSLKESPLVLDYLAIASPDKKWTKVKSSFFERLVSMTQNFFRSFTKDYDSVGDTFNDEEGAVINVWIGNGREWAELIKDLVDEDFTPTSGIRVNINTVPAGQMASGSANTLLLAASSGRAPDVATNLEATLPVEFAIRDAVINLNQFDDYEKTVEQFLQGSLIPFKYNGGDYALPETQDFNLVFYRKDILSQLKLGIPNTWEDLYKILPILQRNGMNAWIPASLDPFLYQQGGSFYNDSLNRTGLDTPEAYTAFKEWTDIYTNYQLPIEANFFNRMRSGEMPIGIANYTSYVQFSVAAPELTGRWGIAPSPGTIKADGTIDRTAGGAVYGSVIFKQSEHQQEAWEFLKWWMSKEVQLRFGQELESLIGVEARWNTANTEAFKDLPWPKEDLEAFQEQWKWYRERPVVPGGYFTTRHISNAWNRVVLSGTNPRESIEQAVKDINKELKAKQEEFGITAPKE
ncbi:ABC-type glycerol-3-phosphate transport system substrate-binding protein [Paenibacillus castaneae]|uniref:extracellular solute-binding protein n=1 Tax=Paenibacillus castaneae TaxID=474957 RepID=UPI00141B814B|nr:extracellular solute-binding protein [Paenibacillus castaneae]NIK80433.1 ABC-type glycerol-3-phosphate transport system substrate-binding protein [Paenibacillus castaneae]